jgi:spore coat polysaccharide biosynthesis protein SpsF
MIVAILQARVSSTRLPGKVLKPLMGVPMLERQIERIQAASMISQLIVATSDQPEDDPIAELCECLGILCTRGSLNDVLDRFYQAALTVDPLTLEHIVRLTGDCPLIDYEIMDQVIRHHLEGGFDYTSNVLPPSFPDGLDVEVFRFTCLEQAWREAKKNSEREHVTPFINRQPERFAIGEYKHAEDLSYLRWTVDEPLDFELVDKLYQVLYPQNHLFHTPDILAFLEENPEWKTHNTHYERNEGYLKSVGKDSGSDE